MKRVTLILILFTFCFSAAFAKLQLKLPTEITGEKPATIFDNQLESNLNIQVPADVAPMMMDKGAILVGLMADATFPLGDFANGWSTGFSGHAMLGYMFAKSVLVNLMVGYTKFSTKEDTGDIDVSFSWVPILLGLHYVFNPGQKFMPFIGAALGLYIINSSYSYTYTIFGQTYSESGDESTSKFGIAPRLGAYFVVSAAVLLTVMAEYNLIFTEGSSTSALGVLVGANFAIGK